MNTFPLVEDDGRGIPEDARDKIFQAFARVAELHGGVASVDSSSSLAGACFSIRWPQRGLTSS